MADPVHQKVRRRATLGAFNQGTSTGIDDDVPQRVRRMTLGSDVRASDLTAHFKQQDFFDQEPSEDPLDKIKEDLKAFHKKITAKQKLPIFKNEFHKVIFEYVESRAFAVFILVVILMNTGILIAQTWVNVIVRTGWYLTAIDNIFLGIYIMEVCVKIAVWGVKYFKDGWNILDFTIVLFSTVDFFLPLVIQNMDGFNGAAIFRLLRIFRTVKALRALRVLRTIRFLNTLQVILGTLLQSIRSIGAIVMLISLFMYMFAVVGRGLYAETDPYHFGSIFTTLFTLFQLLTLDDWFEIHQTVSSAGQSHIIAYLLIYIVVEYFVFLNLFVAVLVDNFQLTLESQNDPNLKKKNDDDSDDEDDITHNVDPEFQDESGSSDDSFADVIKKDLGEFYHCDEQERKLLQEYFCLLASLDYNNQQILNHHRILDMMVDTCKT